MSKFSKVLLASLIAASAAVHAERFRYSELQVKDYDEMQAEVKKRVKVYQKLSNASDADASNPPSGAVEKLREAFQLMLSRPNQDNMLGKLLPEVRKELVTINSFEDTLSSLANEAIEGLRNDKFITVHRSTYYFVLENILSEFKPEIREKEDIRRVFERIRDAGLKIPREVQKDLKLRSMLSVESPSDRAKRILETLVPAKGPTGQSGK